MAATYSSNININLSSDLLSQLKKPGVYADLVWFGGVTSAQGTGQPILNLISDGTPSATNLVTNPAGGAYATLNFTVENSNVLTGLNGGKIYLIVEDAYQSISKEGVIALVATDPIQGQISKNKVIDQSLISPASALKYNFRFDSAEMSFQNSAYDAADLTEVNGFGFPTALWVPSGSATNTPAQAVIAQPGVLNGTPRTVGYNINGSSIWTQLGQTNPLTTQGLGTYDFYNGTLTTYPAAPQNYVTGGTNASLTGERFGVAPAVAVAVNAGVNLGQYGGVASTQSGPNVNVETPGPINFKLLSSGTLTSGEWVEDQTASWSTSINTVSKDQSSVTLNANEIWASGDVLQFYTSQGGAKIGDTTTTVNASPQVPSPGNNLHLTSYPSVNLSGYSVYDLSHPWVISGTTNFQQVSVAPYTGVSPSSLELTVNGQPASLVWNANDVIQFAKLPYSAKDWSTLTTSLANNWVTSGVVVGQIAGLVNGTVTAVDNYSSVDTNTQTKVWHNQAFYNYQIVTATSFYGGGQLNSGHYFILKPLYNSQVQGYAVISEADLQNSIYSTLGNTQIFQFDPTQPSNQNQSPLLFGNSSSTNLTVPTSGTSNPGATQTPDMNTGANNQWGKLFTQFLSGLDTGYYGGIYGLPTNSLNPNKTNVSLVDSWNWSPSYGYGNTATTSGSSSGTAGSGLPAYNYYDQYAKVFFNNTNAYGAGYSDNIASLYKAGGPLLSVWDFTAGQNVGNLNWSIFSDSETPVITYGASGQFSQTAYNIPYLGNLNSGPYNTSYANNAGLGGAGALNIPISFAQPSGPVSGASGVAVDPAQIAVSLSVWNPSTQNFDPVIFTGGGFIPGTSSGSAITGQGTSGIFQTWNLIYQSGSYTAKAVPQTFSSGTLLLNQLPVQELDTTVGTGLTSGAQTSSAALNLSAAPTIIPAQFKATNGGVISQGWKVTDTTAGWSTTLAANPMGGNAATSFTLSAPETWAASDNIVFTAPDPTENTYWYQLTVTNVTPVNGVYAQKTYDLYFTQGKDGYFLHQADPNDPTVFSETGAQANLSTPSYNLVLNSTPTLTVPGNTNDQITTNYQVTNTTRGWSTLITGGSGTTFTLLQPELWGANDIFTFTPQKIQVQNGSIFNQAIDGGASITVPAQNTINNISVSLIGSGVNTFDPASTLLSTATYTPSNGPKADPSQYTHSYWGGTFAPFIYSTGFSNEGIAVPQPAPQPSYLYNYINGRPFSPVAGFLPASTNTNPLYQNAPYSYLLAANQNFVAAVGQSNSGAPNSLDGTGNIQVTNLNNTSVAITDHLLSFGWTGLNNGTNTGQTIGVSNPTQNSNWLSASAWSSLYTNKVNPFDIVKIVITNNDKTTQNIYDKIIYAQADADGNWEVGVNPINPGNPNITGGNSFVNQIPNNPLIPNNGAYISVPVNLAPGTYTVTMQDLNPNAFTHVSFASKGSITDNSKSLDLNTFNFNPGYSKLDNTMLLANWHSDGQQWRAGGYLDANNSYKYKEVNQKIAINTIATTSTDTYVTLQDAVTWANGDTITIYDAGGLQIGTAIARNSTPAPGEHPSTWVPVNPDPAPLSNSYGGATGELTAASIISSPLTLTVGGGSSSIIFENYTGPGPITVSISATVYEIYDGVFARLPDKIGFDFWSQPSNYPGTPEALAAKFMTTPEYQAQYASVGPTTSNAANLNFVELVYAHVLGRAGDPLGIAYWTNCLDLQYGVSGAPIYTGPGTPQAQTREQVIAYLSTSPENVKELTTLGFINATNNTFTLEPSA